MKIKEHLAEMHKAQARFHVAMAKCHKAEMEKSDMGQDEQSFHKSAMAAHTSAAETHVAACQECEKAEEPADLTKRGEGLQPLPAGLSFLAPEARENLARSVERYGQRSMSGGAAPVVPIQFEKLVAVELGD